MEDKVVEAKLPTLNPILKCISFCFGLVGIFLYVFYYDAAPQKAKSAIRYTLMGALTFLLVVIILLLITGQSDLFNQ